MAHLRTPFTVVEYTLKSRSESPPAPTGSEITPEEDKSDTRIGENLPPR